ncbi:MAG: FtsX-like permease family protein, partial [Actinobacteria bacterium]|nr:FtsX-like permease family protein [Actinomycetota bacterium]
MRARLWRRLAGSTPGASLAIVLIVAVAAGLFTAWPRLLQQVLLEEVDHRIATTPPTVRALAARGPGWPDTTPGWDERIRATLDGLAASAGPELRAGLGEPVVVVEATQVVPILGPEGPSDLATRDLKFRVDPAIAERVRLVDGALPAPSERDRLLDELFTTPPTDPGFRELSDRLESPDLPPSEVMMSTASAARLGLTVGDVLEVPGSMGNGRVLLAGTFEALDPADSYWQHQVSVLAPLIRDDPNAGLLATATAYPHPDTLRWVQELTQLQGAIHVWFPVTPQVTDAEVLLADLRDFGARSVAIDGPFGIDSLRLDFSTGLTAVLERALGVWNSTNAVLTMVLAGPAGVTAALLALTVRLAVSRRRTTLALASARGGSPGQLRGALGAEGLLLGLPAAALGAGAATLAIPGAVLPGHYLLAAVAGLAPAVFLAATPLPSLRPVRPDLAGRSRSRWRWVAEVAVVALAAGAVYLLADRGVAADAATAGVDPLTAGAPLLVAVAAAVLVARAFPVLLRAVHAVTRRRPGLSGFLGSARAIRGGSGGLVTMLALVVGVSIAVFSTTMLATVTAGVGAAARDAVGADVRLTGPYYTAEELAAIRAVDGVASATEVVEVPLTHLYEIAGTGSAVDQQSRRVTLVAVDTATLAETQRGISGAVTLPPGMDRLVDGRLPLVLASGQQLTDGVELELLLEERVPVTIAGRASAATGLAGGTSWAIVDLGLLREQSGERLPSRTVLVGLSDGADRAAALAALSDAVGGRGTVTSPAGDEASFLDSPSAAAMQAGFRGTLAVAAAQVVLAVVLALVLAAPERARLLAVLRTLGISAREARRLVSWETVPVVVVAVPAGALLGLALPHLVQAAVDLRPFTGGADQPPITPDWALLALVGVVG